jgi:rubrerythrin
MRFADRLSLRFNRKVVATPRGRAHVLNQLAEAESGGEARIFDEALARVDSPEVARLIRNHRDDELRHAELFRAALARTGVPMPPVPEHLKIVDRLDRYLGGVIGRTIEDGRGVMEAYLLLQVVEERATHQFTLLERAFREVDPETADVIAEVAKDEERHLRYCQAIANRFAPDEETRRTTLERYRRVEALAFRDNSHANLRHLYENGIVGPAWTGLFWRGLTALVRKLGALPMTPFAREREIETRELQVA